MHAGRYDSPVYREPDRTGQLESLVDAINRLDVLIGEWSRYLSALHGEGAAAPAEVLTLITERDELLQRLRAFGR